MKTEWKEHAWRLILTLLLSLGLLLPLLHGMELPFHPAGIFFIILLFSSLLEAISLNRRFLLTGLLVLSSFFLIWLLFGGLGILLDLTRAISLQLSGIDYAVPLLSGTLARVLAVMFTLLCFFCSRKGAGGVPALLLCVSVLLLIWLADRFELIWFHLPALIAALMLLMMDRHPELSPARISLRAAYAPFRHRRSRSEGKSGSPSPANSGPTFLYRAAGCFFPHERRILSSGHRAARRQGNPPGCARDAGFHLQAGLSARRCPE